MAWERIDYSRHRVGNMHAARRTGDVGLVHRYHGRKKHGYRCGMGRHVKVCNSDYPIQKQKGGSILCKQLFDKPLMNEIINHIKLAR